LARRRTVMPIRTGELTEIEGVLQDESIHRQAISEQKLLAQAGFEDFDPLDMKVRLSLIAAANELVATVEEELRPFGLSGSTFNVLMTIRHSPYGTLKMSEVADLIVMRPRNLTPLMDALVADGYVQRQPSETDRRVVQVQLTDDGEARLDALLPRLFRKLGTALSDLSEEEKLACIGAVTKVRIGLKATRGDDGRARAGSGAPARRRVAPTEPVRGQDAADAPRL